MYSNARQGDKIVHNWTRSLKDASLICLLQIMSTSPVIIVLLNGSVRGIHGAYSSQQLGTVGFRRDITNNVAHPYFVYVDVVGFKCLLAVRSCASTSFSQTVQARSTANRHTNIWLQHMSYTVVFSSNVKRKNTYDLWRCAHTACSFKWNFFTGNFMHAASKMRSCARYLSGDMTLT